MNVPVLASTRIVFLICSVNGGIEDSLEKFRALSAVIVTISGLVIHGATGSRLHTWCMYLNSMLFVSGAVLRKAYDLDLHGRVVPHTAEDAIHPHWSAPLLFALMNLALLIGHAAALHAAIGHSHLQPPHLLPTITSSLMKSTAAALPTRHVIPALISAVRLCEHICVQTDVYACAQTCA